MIIPNGFPVDDKLYYILNDHKQRDASDENGRHELQREVSFGISANKAQTRGCSEKVQRLN